MPQGRVNVAPEVLKKTEPWQARELNEEQVRNNPQVIPEGMRPEVILRFGDAKGLLLSGLLDKAGSIAEHAVVVDARIGQKGERAAVWEQPGCTEGRRWGVTRWCSMRF